MLESSLLDKELDLEHSVDKGLEWEGELERAHEDLFQCKLVQKVEALSSGKLGREVEALSSGILEREVKALSLGKLEREVEALSLGKLEREVEALSLGKLEREVEALSQGQYEREVHCNLPQCNLGREVDDLYQVLVDIQCHHPLPHLNPTHLDP